MVRLRSQTRQFVIGTGACCCVGFWVSSLVISHHCRGQGVGVYIVFVVDFVGVSVHVHMALLIS